MKLCPDNDVELDQLAGVIDAPLENEIAAIGLPLVDDRFQAGRHDRVLSGREVGAVVVWVVDHLWGEP
ncbi:hypothetical protein ACFWP5_37940 [Streptomyces sp. NPDC058469]|uniref:hypothetical protein n=1 Tax=Streptomyces sp. NPDC058469 TaxID=3346514 RepID=UPI00365AC0CD